MSTHKKKTAKQRKKKKTWKIFDRISLIFKRKGIFFFFFGGKFRELFSVKIEILVDFFGDNLKKKKKKKFVKIKRRRKIIEVSKKFNFLAKKKKKCWKEKIEKNSKLVNF